MSRRRSRWQCTGLCCRERETTRPDETQLSSVVYHLMGTELCVTLWNSTQIKWSLWFKSGYFKPPKNCLTFAQSQNLAYTGSYRLVSWMEATFHSNFLLTLPCSFTVEGLESQSSWLPPSEASANCQCDLLTFQRSWPLWYQWWYCSDRSICACSQSCALSAPAHLQGWTPSDSRSGIEWSCCPSYLRLVRA